MPKYFVHLARCGLILSAVLTSACHEAPTSLQEEQLPGPARPTLGSPISEVPAAFLGMPRGYPLPALRTRQAALSAAQIAPLKVASSTTAILAGSAQDLGGTDGFVESFAYDINLAGQVAGYDHRSVYAPEWQAEIGDVRAIIWENGEPTTLPRMGGYYEVAVSINNDGDVAGTARDPATFQEVAVIWKDGVLIPLPPFSSEDATFGYSAHDINNLGQVVGQAFLQDQWRAVRWDEGFPTALAPVGDVGRGGNVATAINDHGQVVGRGGNGEAVLWEGETAIVLSGMYFAQDINNLGQVVGRGGSGAVIWENGHLTELGMGEAYAINDAGEVTGWVSDPETGYIQPAIWRSGQVTQLPTLGGSHGIAYGVAAGHAIGMSLTADERQHATRWILDQTTEPDADGDGVGDAEDNCPTVSNPDQADADGDAIGDACETPEPEADSDADGLHDAKDNCPLVANPNQEDFNADGKGDHCSDIDGDTLTDAEELQKYGTKPTTRDTDGDSLTDDMEVRRHGTNPTILDTDKDKLSDGEEVNKYRTDPLKADTDGDGASDGAEVAAGTDPLSSPDKDGDLVPDTKDNCLGVANPKQEDFNADGKGDACTDTDSDGLTDADELQRYGTKPEALDTDGDGASDGAEVAAGTDPLTPADADGDGLPDMKDNCPAVANPTQEDFNADGRGDACTDTDGDGLTDADELLRYRTNPQSPDTDSDGASDGVEIATGTDPLKVYSFTGFLQPVDNSGVLNVAKAGSAIPVKFRLAGYQGLDIFRPADANGAYPQIQFTRCEGTGTDAIEQTVTANASGLTYDAANDTYTYVWKTEKAWGGRCGTLRLGLKDGSEHTALFRFTK